jgi:hypothetical protein
MLRAFIATLFVMPALCVRKSIQNHREGFEIAGCPEDAEICKCTTASPVKELPLFTRVHHFGYPMMHEFYVTQAGHRQLKEKAGEHQLSERVVIKCEEFKALSGMIEDIPCSTCESTEGPVAAADRGAAPTYFCLNGPVERVAGTVPGMCLSKVFTEEPELLRCGTKKKDGSDKFDRSQYKWYMRPSKASTLEWQRKSTICEAYEKVHSTKHVYCMWVPAVDIPEDIPEKDQREVLGKACRAAVGNLGVFENDHAFFLKHEARGSDGSDDHMCHYDMKLEKCLYRLQKEHVLGGAWARSNTS